MRVELLTPRLETSPGASCEVELEVFNTGEVIDSVTSRVVGHPFDATQSPPQLSLFPDSGDRLSVRFVVPDEFPAGSHTVPIEIASTFQQDVALAELELEVEPRIAAEMRLTPSDVTSGRKAKLAVDIENTGNTPLDLTLTGNDLERVLRFRFEPLFVHVEPGERVTASAVAVGKRPFFGSPVTRAITILAWGKGIDLAAPGRFNQKPRIPRGVLTILALTAVIAIWAAVFVAGANLVLAGDALTKTVPETFLVGDTEFEASTVAGALTGIVTAESNGSPVERITVEAYRIGKDGPVLVGSAASADDGAWELASVVPGAYHLRFTAPGFEEVWYPGAPSEAGAQDVRVRPVATTDALNVSIAGSPGSVTGAILAGEQAEIIASILVRPVVEDAVGEVVAMVETSPDGTFTVPGLPTPATYELGIILAGFDQQSVRVELSGGEAQVINSVNMAAAPGTLGGTVVGPDGALGGVEVTLSGSGQDLSVATPTDGEVGSWVFTDLPTPGTYLLTFTLDGYGTQTVAVDLRAGQARDGVIIEMLEGTGRVSGLVTDASGNPLGGVTVTVTGGAEPLETLTLTTGDVGAYVLTGLETPGRYTITFSLDGYASQTIGVDLSSGGSADDMDAELTRSTSSIIGTVSAGGRNLAGAAITVTDGLTVRSTTSADDPAGGYRFDALPAGRYTVTISLDGYESRTILVALDRGETETVDAVLGAS